MSRQYDPKPGANYFNSIWEPAQIPAGGDLGQVLIFAESDGLRAALGGGVLVTPADAFSESGDNYTLNPADGETWTALQKALKSRKFVPQTVVFDWARDDFGADQLERALSYGVDSMYHFTRALMKLRPKQPVPVLFLFRNHGQGAPQYAGCSGVARTVRKEAPKFLFKTVELTEMPADAELADLVRAEAADHHGIEISYRDGTRLSRRLKGFRPFADAQPMPLTKGGAVILTGGLGGLGLIFARFLAKQGANLVLTGRSKINDKRQKQLDELEAETGCRAIYVSGDIAARDDVFEMVDQARQTFGAVHGIVHSAGVNRDSFIVQKSFADLHTVLDCKTQGTVWLDAATADDKLDFFITYSSITALVGNPGQAGYAYGNRFMDYFVEWREVQTAKGARSGRSLSVNWPLWASGGMGVDPAIEKALKKALGMVPMRTEYGLKAFVDGFQSPHPGYLAIEGDEAEIIAALGALPADEAPAADTSAVQVAPVAAVAAVTTVAEPVQPAEPIEPADLAQQAETFLRELIAGQFKVPLAKYDNDRAFEEYGIDSVMILDLSGVLEKHFGGLPKTMFFENTNLTELLEYFLEDHRDKLIAKFGVAPAPAAAPAAPQAAVPVTSQTPIAPKKLNFAVAPSPLRVQAAPSPMAASPVAPAPPAPPAPAAASVSLSEDALRQKTADFLRELIAGQFKVPVAKYDDERAFEEYGIDSVMIVDLSAALEKAMGELPKTIFFENQNLSELVDYFLEDHSDTLRDRFEESAAAQPSPPVAQAPKPVVQAAPVAVAAQAATPGPVKPLSFGRKRMSAPASRKPSATAPTQVRRPNRDEQVEIAIVGLAGRYPQAENVFEFWDNLRQGRDCIEEIPQERWDWSQFYDPAEGKKGKTNSRWGGFITDFDKFDPLFFSISPKEAEAIDPNERLFLETAWAAVEDAGYTRKQLWGSRTGVYAGVMWAQYQVHGAEASLGGPVTMPNSMYAAVANRVSFTFNFNGPSMSVDTMCSSSLTTLHLACESIRRGECDQALIGGVNLTTHPSKYLALATSNFTSSDGRCRAFGVGGDGYVPGEGVGVLFLKRLDQAVSDDDQVYAVVRATALNHGGRANGFTVPNPKAQGNLIGEAITRAGWNPGTLGYLEAHGTGTSLGDPIEINGLERAFKGSGMAKQSCPIGSVKSNVGHLEAASGVVAITKVVLQMRYNQLVPSIHSQDLNPNIDFENASFSVQRELGSWPQRDNPKRAGISSFGAGGSNGHILLEEFPRQRTGVSLTRGMFVLSAVNSERLSVYAAKMLDFLKNHDHNQLDFADIVYTSQVAREAFNSRLAIIAETKDDLISKLHDVVMGHIEGPGRVVGHIESDDHEAPEVDDATLSQLFADQDLDGLAKLWVAGLEVDWSRLYGAGLPHRVSIPTYPFRRDRHWIRGAKTPAVLNSAARMHPLVERNTSTLRTQRFSTQVTGNEFYVADHNIGGKLLYPGAAYLEMARAAGAWSAECPVTAVRNLTWSRPTIVDRESGARLDVTFDPQPSGVDFSVSNAMGECASGQLIFDGMVSDGGHLDLAEIRERLTETHNADDLYAGFDAMGFRYGPGMRGIVQAQTGPGEVLAEIQLPRAVASGADHFLLHPVLVDSAMHSGLALSQAGGPMLAPHGIEELIIHGKPGNNCIVYGREIFVEDKEKHFEFMVCDEEGNLLLHLKRFVAKALVAAATTPVVSRPAAVDMAAVDADAVAQGAQQFLLELVANRFQISAGDFNPRDNFEKYGIDSVIIGEITTDLSKHFDDVPDTLLFECKSVDELLAFFQEEHPQTLASMFAAGSASVDQSTDPEASRAGLNQFLAAILAAEFGLNPAELDPKAAFENYGIDSVMIGNITAQLGKHFEDLPDTLLFEFKTQNELAEYFLEDHAESVTQQFDGGSETIAVETKPEVDGDDNSVDPTVVPYDYNTLRLGGGSARPEEIAIVGLGGRYPDCADLHDFWGKLLAGTDFIREIPAERWDYTPYFDTDKRKKNKTYAKWGSFLNDVDKFDPAFFNISFVEAEIMPPEERFFLETAWATLEDAGYAALDKPGRPIGVYVGMMWSDYGTIGSEHMAAGGRSIGSSSHASIANRVSFCLNLNGPCMTVDTMCSSSLTTVHLACEAIRNGECDMALAGGVNFSLHPYKFLSLAQRKFLAVDGRCRTFGEGGDGYVPGEGAGAILLKPLSAAEADGDQIYGLVRATVLNHGGKTNGFTVPDPVAQGKLIENAYRVSGFGPETVGYVEAHGTGTALGDPIEISGLMRAFKKGMEQRQGAYCAIGSVKANIGHMEGAAGVIGITKVLLQMKHKTIAPSIHSSTLNPKLKLEKTPFRVPQKPEPWQPLLDEAGAALPYRAGISSFGAGGSNAHVILESYGRGPVSAVSSDGPYLFVLSARDEDRLNTFVQRFVDFLQDDTRTGSLDPAALAWTVQNARQHHAQRLALPFTDRLSLVVGLENYLAGKGDHASGKLKGFEKAHPQADAWLAARDLKNLAAAWVEGAAINWADLYDTTPVKLSLPTYPFARKRFWLGKTYLAQAPQSTAPSSGGAAVLHPLLHRNISNFQEQAFETTLAGSGYYMKDHQVEGNPMLPGAAYVEMARAAAQIAVGSDITRIREVVWVQPVTGDGNQDRDLKLVVAPEGNRVAFQALSGTGAKPLVHCRAKLELGPAQPPAPIDLAAVAARCPDLMSAGDCYAELSGRGLEYGPSFRTIGELRSNGSEALASLSLPAHLAGDFDEYRLHPALLDGALQCAVGLLASMDKGLTLLPFALEQVDLLGKVPAQLQAYVTMNPVSTTDVKKLDIQLTDHVGNTVIGLRGFSVRALGSAPAKAPAVTRSAPARQGDPVYYFTGTWRDLPAINGTAPGSLLLFSDRADAAAHYNTKVTQVSYGTSFSTAGYQVNPGDESHMNQLVDALLAAGDFPETVVFDWSHAETPADSAALSQDMDRGFYAVFHLTRALMEKRRRGKVRLVFVNRRNGDESSPQFAGLSGLLRTARLENPNYIYKSLEVDASISDSELAQRVTAELSDTQEVEIRYVGGKRQRRKYVQFAQPAVTHDTLPVRDGGVYLITGGLGALGLLFARFIAQRCKAKLVLTGRSALNQAKQAKVDDLKALGAEVLYVPADVADDAAAQRLMDEIRKHFGQLNGVVHSAGVTKDKYLKRKTADEAAAVLGPKLHGTFNLDRISADQPIDFFVLFSSLACLNGNVGQSDYAYGNRYMDYFAAWRQARTAEGMRSGRAISINWPLWAEGGMQIEPAILKNIEKNMGMTPLTNPNGLHAFEVGFAVDANHFLAIQGREEALVKFLDAEPLTASSAPIAAPIKAAAAVPAAVSRNTAANFLTKVVSAEFNIPENEFDPEESFDSYGMDSVIVTNIIAQLEDDFGDLSKTLFFEYQNLNQLADYFIEQHGETLAALLGVTAPPAAPAVAASTTSSTATGDMDVVGYLTQIVSAEFNIPADEFDPDEAFDSYGMDSVIVMNIIGALEEEFGDLSKTLFFEYQNLNQLSAYFSAEHSQTLGRLLGGTIAPAPVVSAPKPASPAAPSPQVGPARDAGNATLEFLTQIVAAEFNIPADEFDPEEPFDGYGMDSVIVMNIIGALEEHFGDLSKTLFFEYQNLNQLTGYFTENHGDQLAGMFAASTPVSAPAAPVASVPQPAAAPVPAHSGDLAKSTVDYLTQIVAAEFNIPADEFDPEEAFDSYGMDSVIVMNIIGALEEEFGDLSKTLFFEYQNLNQLAGYFTADHADTLTRLLGATLSIAAPAAAPASGGDLTKAATDYLTGIVAGEFNIPADEFDPEEAFDAYGMDSVIVMNIIGALEEEFGDLSKTLFFEYQNLNQLAGYFVADHTETLSRLTAVQVVAATPSTPLTPATPAVPAGAVQAPAAAVLQTRFSQTPAIQPAPAAAVVVERPVNRDVAIIGMSGRFPMAPDLDAFWENLLAGKDCIEEVPADRWDHGPFYVADEGAPGRTNSKWGGFITDHDKFDAQFFNMSPKEASLCDPNERIFLEVAWNTMEDAGYNRDRMAGTRTGVYVGLMWAQYDLLGVDPAFYGNDRFPSSILARTPNRVSFNLDLRGPSVAFDTMCSSSITSLHYACEDLISGQVDMAFAGGANFTLHVNKYLTLAQNSFTSRDGRCRAFGAGGSGYVPGEVIAAVMLKPLDQAVADRDPIRAVIKVTALNHGGKASGFTVPNPRSQGGLISEALERGGLDPRTIGAVEAHGTGTPLGDPVEIEGLTRAFGGSKADKQFCSIGSVKSNIGHGEAAAGVAGLAKAVMMLQHRKLPPTIHTDTLNPNIKYEQTPFRVQRALEDFPAFSDAAGRPMARRVGLSSFGAGGSNGHVILEEYVETRDMASHATGPFLLVLSGRNTDRLTAYAQRIHDFIVKTGDVDLGRLCFTLQHGRDGHDERLAFIFADQAELLKNLATVIAGQPVGQSHAGNARKVRRETNKMMQSDAGKNRLSAAFANRDLAELAALWVIGVNIDWTRLYGSQTPAVMWLPTYPFERARQWVGRMRDDIGPSFDFDRIGSIQSSQSAQAVCLETGWRDVAGLTGRFRLERNQVMLVVDESDFGANALRYAAAGEGEVIQLKPGSTYRQLGPFLYEVDTADLQHFQNIANGLAAAGKTPVAVVFLREADRSPYPATVELANGLLDWELIHGAYALFQLIKVLHQQGWTQDLNALYCINGNDSLGAAVHQALSGMAPALAAEAPGCRVRTLTFDPGLAGFGIDYLLSELADPQSNRAVRYQQGRRAVLDRSEVLVAAADSPFKRGANYIMTGCDTDAGYRMAAWLLYEIGANIAVLGGDNQAPSAAQLAEGGARIVHHRVDLSDQIQMDQASARIRAEFGSIDGVLHLASHTEYGGLSQKDVFSFARVIEPKLYGLVALDVATRSDQLDFFMTFNTTLAAVGQAGADAAFGQTFGELFATQRNQRVNAGQAKGRTLSITWSDAPSEDGIGPFDLATAFQQLAGLLALDLSAVTLVAGDDRVLDRLQHDIGAAPKTAAAAPAPAPAAVIQPAPVAEIKSQPQPVQAPIVAVEDPRKRITQVVLDALSSVLQMQAAEVDMSQEFEAFGMDSVDAVKIANGIQKELSGDVSPNHLVEYPTVEELIDALVAAEPAAPDVSVAPAAPASAAAAVEPVLETPQASANTDDVRDRVDLAVKNALSNVLQLKLEEIDPSQEFEAYGMDSVDAVKIVNGIQKELKWDVSPSYLVEYPTIEELIDALVAEATVSQ